MKKLILILLCLPIIGFGQTVIPDINFEQALINLGYDSGAPDGSVPTFNINTVDTLEVQGQNITDLTGIEAFTALTYLDCSDNQLNHIDISGSMGLLTFKCYYNNLTQLKVSSNTSLLYFECYENQLTSLDVSNNIFLTELWCNDNQLTSLDVQGIDMYKLICDNNQLTKIDNLGDNVSLKYLSCSNNDIVSLPLSTLTDLDWFSCSNNQLFELDISNQSGLNYFFCWGNLSLNCINVSDVALANTSWSVFNGQSGNIDPQHYFSINCPSPSAIEEHNINNKVIKIINLLGKEVESHKNELLFYLYNNGSVEQKIILE